MIELLPFYSPELNPAERLWRWLRRHICRNRLLKSLAEQAEALGQTIRNLSAEQIATMILISQPAIQEDLTIPV